MERRRNIWFLVTLVIFLTINFIDASPIIHNIKPTETPEILLQRKISAIEKPGALQITVTKKTDVTTEKSVSPYKVSVTDSHEKSTELQGTEKSVVLPGPGKFSATEKSAALQGKYFDEVMKELNQALKEKAAEEREHINLLLNMTAEMKELSEQVKGMQEKLKKIIGK